MAVESALAKDLETEKESFHVEGCVKKKLTFCQSSRTYADELVYMCRWRASKASDVY